MPPDRSRTANPQGRQKSCSECAKAKRKCGLQQPSCARCSKQHLGCVYPPQPRSQAATSHSGTPDPQIEFDIADECLNFQDVDAPAPQFDFNISDDLTCGTDALDFDFAAGTCTLESLASMLNPDPDGEENMSLQKPYYRVAKPFSLAHLSSFAKSRVEYSLEQLKLAPKRMVEQNGTPWTHPRLYDEHMPRSLQDAHAACALYVTMNETNADHVIRYITLRAEELIFSTLPSAPIEVLARAQALVLYQIIFGFGADMQSCGQARGLLQHLDAVGTSLSAIADSQTDAVGSLPLYPGTAARSAWKSYIFRESVRRTVLSLFHVYTMCNLLRGSLMSCVHTLAFGNRVTLSAHLWNAKNAFDFALAWNDRKHFLLKELDFTMVLKDANPDDVDDFGRMLMVAIQGVDDIRGWFYTRGGVL